MTWRQGSRRNPPWFTLRTAACLFLALGLSACASAGLGSDESQRLANIPGPPDYLRPVPEVPARPGDSWPVIAEKRGAALKQANVRLSSGRKLWSDMKSELAKPLSQAR